VAGLGETIFFAASFSAVSVLLSLATGLDWRVIMIPFAVVLMGFIIAIAYLNGYAAAADLAHFR